MTELEKFLRVNSCDSLEELAQAIESFADGYGDIQGRARKHNARNMASACRNYNPIFFNALTREYGIRQQAIYLLFRKGDL